MSKSQHSKIFDWFADQFTSEARAEFIARVGPYLTSLIQPGARALDLCCGRGPIAFYLEEQGAVVTGIDLAPGLIALAQEEAVERKSKVDFIRANALTHDLGHEEYNLVVCLGNAILDFPHENFCQFRDHVHQALKPGGRLVIEYRDGVLRLDSMREPRTVREQSAAGPIQREFKEYDPTQGAYIMEYRNMTTGENYKALGYVYTGPMIRLAMEEKFQWDESRRLGKQNFLDTYTKQI